MTLQPFSTALYLPDFLASWPYERRLNPYCVKVSKAAYTWISSYGLLTPKLQRAFQLGNSGLDFYPLTRCWNYTYLTFMPHSQVFWQHWLTLTRARVIHLNIIRSRKSTNVIISFFVVHSTPPRRLRCPQYCPPFRRLL